MFFLRIGIFFFCCLVWCGGYNPSIRETVLDTGKNPVNEKQHEIKKSTYNLLYRPHRQREFARNIMDSDLELFDIIVVGTGLVESILASALARAQKKVLHLDSNNFYGSDWTTLTPLDFMSWSNSLPTTTTTTTGSHPPFKCTSVWTIEDEDRCRLPLLPTSTGESKDQETETSSTTIVITPPPPPPPPPPPVPRLSHETVGALVETKLGLLGVVTGCQRSTGMLVVSLDWLLSNGRHATLQALPSSLRIVGVGTSVRTQEGVRGKITKVHLPMMESRPQYGSRESREEAERSMPADTYEIKPVNEQTTTATMIVPPCQLLSSPLLQKKHQRHRENARRRGAPPSTPLEHVLHDARTYQLDLSPQLLLSSGTAVETLVRSGVHEYVEFLPMDQMFVAEVEEEVEVVEKKKTRREEGCKIFRLRRVPCSKADVFQTSSLSMLDKRVLMKFLRFAMDVETGTTDDMISKNEKMLGKGRSLTRPQNAPKLAYSDYQNFLNLPIEKFYDRCSMSKSLRSIVTHAIGFVSRIPADVKTKDGLRSIQKILSSLGRYGKSPFLCTKYGNSELPQAFCRLCAVYGGVYMLRVEIESVLCGDVAVVSGGGQEEEEEGGGGGGGGEATGSVSMDEYLTGVVLVEEVEENEAKKKKRVIRSKHIVVAPEYIHRVVDTKVETKVETKEETKDTSTTTSTTTSTSVEGGEEGVLCRCVCISRQSIPGTNDGDKAVVVVPPDVVNNEEAIHVVQLSSQVCVVPKERYVVHLTTVATDGEQGEAALRRVVSRLYVGTRHGEKEIKKKEKSGERGVERVVDPVVDPVDWSGYYVEERETTTLAERRAALPKNVHCRRRVRTTECGAPIDVDVAFEEAERMFKVLCPNKKFLPERNASTSNGSADDQGNKEMEEEEDDDSDMSGLDSDDDYGV